MQCFRTFITEMAWMNNIGKASRERSVAGNDTYNSAKDFKPNAKHLGHVGSLELHSSDTAGGGRSHFTWNPADKKIHHVVHAAQVDGKELKFMSSHKREGSPVKMHQVYASLIKDHGHTLVGTSHSPGEASAWNNLEKHHGIKIQGRDQSGSTRALKHDEPRYAPYDAKDPTHKSIGRLNLVAAP
jgi:hypothetical protein